MTPKLRAPKDLGAGLFYIATGTGVIIVARGYTFGTASDMGPGYFPSVLGGVLLLLGAIAVARAFRHDGDQVGYLAIRPLLIILASIVLFAVALPLLGLPIALFLLAMLSAAASTHFRFDASALVGLIVIIALCTAFFAGLLQLPMPYLGSWLAR